MRGPRAGALLLAGLLAGAGAVAWLESAAGPSRRGAAEDAADVELPMDTLPLAGTEWDRSPDGANGSAGSLRIVELGSAEGAVEAGGSTDVCARVVDGDGAGVADAQVAFWADGGRFEPDRAASAQDGLACVRFAAPTEAGSVVVRAQAEAGNETTPVADAAVEVLARHAGSHHASGEHAAPGLSYGWVAIAIGAAFLLAWRRG